MSASQTEIEDLNTMTPHEKDLAKESAPRGALWHSKILRVIIYPDKNAHLRCSSLTSCSDGA